MPWCVDNSVQSHFVIALYSRFTQHLSLPGGPDHKNLLSSHCTDLCAHVNDDFVITFQKNSFDVISWDFFLFWILTSFFFHKLQMRKKIKEGESCVFKIRFSRLHWCPPILGIHNTSLVVVYFYYRLSQVLTGVVETLSASMPMHALMLLDEAFLQNIF